MIDRLMIVGSALLLAALIMFAVWADQTSAFITTGLN